MIIVGSSGPSGFLRERHFVFDQGADFGVPRNCPRCRQPRPTSKRFSLARLPHYFIFHLKRFSSFSTVAQKVNTPVDFPLDELDLGGYLPPPLPNVSLNAPHEKSTVYELYAVCNHYEADRNGLNGGHCAFRFLLRSRCRFGAALPFARPNMTRC